MRFLGLALLALTVAGCSKDGDRTLVPTTPNAPVEPPSIWVMVINKSGGCIEAAMVGIVRGQATNEFTVQRCPEGGVKFLNLRPGEEVTLRAVATRYGRQDVTLLPATAPHRPVLIALPNIGEGASEVSRVSGFVYEHTAGGSRPLGGLLLTIHGRSDSGASVTTHVVTDAAGRYELAGLTREYVQIEVRPQSAYLSPCGAHQWFWNDDPVNVHVVSRETLRATGTPPSMPPLSLKSIGASFLRPPGYEFADEVSGFVTERTPDGVRPVAEASVEHFYGDGRSGDPTGFTLTRSDGSFVLCGYFDDYGKAVRVRKDGYRTSIQSIASWPPVRTDVDLVRD
jgi:hypothetical protein